MTLENLLNALIQRGWKPFGWEEREAKKGSYNNLYYGFDSHPELHHIRMLVSKESGLWQFVCENGMVKERNTRRENHKIHSGAFMIFRKTDYVYRLIESALKDESELDSFILDNIKIEG